MTTDQSQDETNLLLQDGSQCQLFKFLIVVQGEGLFVFTWGPNSLYAKLTKE